MGLHIWAADEAIAISFTFAVWRYVNAAYSMCDGLPMEQKSKGG